VARRDHHEGALMNWPDAVVVSVGIICTFVFLIATMRGME
jgi:hypothetical protein